MNKAKKGIFPEEYSRKAKKSFAFIAEALYHSADFKVLLV
jgi:hypothetical protein